MSERVEVWVVQSVLVHGRIEGVYSSVERAIAAHPVTSEMWFSAGPHHTRAETHRGGGWEKEWDGCWSNGLAGDYYQVITRYVVDEDPDTEDAIGART